MTRYIPLHPFATLLFTALMFALWLLTGLSVFTLPPLFLILLSSWLVLGTQVP